VLHLLFVIWKNN